MRCGIPGFELRYGQDVDMEGLNRSAETVANLLRNEKTEGEVLFWCVTDREVSIGGAHICTVVIYLCVIIIESFVCSFGAVV